MNSKFQIYPLFPTPVFYGNVDGFVNDIINFDSIDLSQFFDNNKQQKTFNSINQQILLEPKFSVLKQIIDDCVFEYVFNQLKYPKDLSLDLVCSWLLLGYPGSETNSHLHTNSIFSGVFYLKSEEDSGDIFFSIPYHQMTYTTPTVTPYPTEYNLYNSRSWKFSPKTNDILIFPSHLLHGVTENKSNEVRCALSFNYFISGNICNDVTRTLNL